MGTTLTALQNDAGVRISWVLAIEGVSYLLTDSTALDTSAGGLFESGKGWDGTDWSQALSGLTIDGDFDQSIDPWDPKLQVSEMKFRIMDFDDADTFGIEVHRGGSGNTTDLSVAFDPDDTVLTVKENANFPSSGDVYLGGERIGYTGKGTTPDTFTTLTRGKFAPFQADGASMWGRNHTIASLDFDVFVQPKVSEQPRVWIGKWVGLYAHRITSEGWDTKANAQLLWAGRIIEIQDTERGETVVTCQDVRAKLRDTTLLHDQFRGRLREGVHLATWMRFDATEKTITDANPNIYVTSPADQLVVAASDSGANQIAEGYYTYQELLNAINTWLSDEGPATDNNIKHWWQLSASTTLDGTRTRIEGHAVDIGVDYANFKMTFSMPKEVLVFLGFLEYGNGIGQNNEEIFLETDGTDPEPVLVSDSPPLKALAFQGPDGASSNSTITLTSTQGTWMSDRDWLPEPWKTQDTVTGEDWGLFQINGPQGKTVGLAKFNGTDTFTNLKWPEDLQQRFGSQGVPVGKVNAPRITIDEVGYIEVRQLVALEGTFKDIVARLFASTGASAYNHATYDDFSAQLGAAIPWDLLGDEFTLSLDNLSQSGSAGGFLLVMDKPMRLWDVLAADLLLRSAYLVWKNGGLRFTTLQRAPGTVAVHTFTEANKGSALEGDPQRASTLTDRSVMRNSYKIAYNRDLLSGTYRDFVDAKFSASISDHGESRTVEIQARNSYGKYGATGDAVQELIVDLVAKVAPTFGVPLKRLRRTITFAHFENIAPGDIATVTDLFARDPSSGTRGLANYTAIVLSTSHSWGGSGADVQGEVELLILDRDAVAIYSPSAKIDDTQSTGDYDAGYDPVGVTIQLYQNEFSESSEANDGTHFVEGDVIQIVEIDPATAGSPIEWTRTLGAPLDDDQHLLTAALSSPSWDNTKTYYVISAPYGSATSTQITDTYQADDADLRVVDTVDPYEYGAFHSTIAWSAAAPTQLPDRHSTTLFGDGAPMSTAAHRSVSRMANNLINYKTAIQGPMMWPAIIQSPETAIFNLIKTWPMFYGVGFALGQSRLLEVMPGFYSSDGTSVSVRVTTSRGPAFGAALNAAEFPGSFSQQTWSTTAQVAGDWYAAGSKTIPPSYDPETGLGWISVEISGDVGVTCNIAGLSEVWLRPLAA